MLRDSPYFGFQLNESIDISGEAQLLVYCRFPDSNTSRISEHMFIFCDSAGVHKTGISIFIKVADSFLKKISYSGRNV